VRACFLETNKQCFTRVLPLVERLLTLPTRAYLGRKPVISLHSDTDNPLSPTPIKV